MHLKNEFVLPENKFKQYQFQYPNFSDDVITIPQAIINGGQDLRENLHCIGDAAFPSYLIIITETLFGP